MSCNAGKFSAFSPSTPRFQMTAQCSPAHLTPPHNISSLLPRRLLCVRSTGSPLLFPFNSVRTFGHRVRSEERCLVQGENTGDKMNLSHREHIACQMEQTCPCSTTEQKALQTHSGTHFHPCCCFCFLSCAKCSE